MSEARSFEIPPRSARAFEVAAGETVRITDTEGGQPGDLIAFRRDELNVRFSQTRTRVENGKVRVGESDSLWTSTQPPEAMLTIVRDTGGPHDLLYTPCCRYALEKRFGVSEDGCLENLAQALAPWGIVQADIPDPLNLFFRVSVDSDGRMQIAPSDSPPGAFIELRAEMPCLLAVSTCPVPVAGRRPTGYAVEFC